MFWPLGMPCFLKYHDSFDNIGLYDILADRHEFPIKKYFQAVNTMSLSPSNTNHQAQSHQSDIPVSICHKKFVL